MYVFIMKKMLLNSRFEDMGHKILQEVLLNVTI